MGKPLHSLAIAGALIVGLGAAALFVLPGNENTGLLKPENADVVARGKDIYDETCAACHGANLKGEADWQTPKADGLLPAPPHDVSGHTWHHSSQLLFDMTKYGVAEAANLENYQSAMPAYEGVLTDDEIIAVLSFIKASWPEDVRARHDALDAVTN
ncbi:cytochrome c [Labrenzia sp. R4_2]|uniref:c-type cytochrome n=1 Tax=Labrenzia sp. R4_2 TaxID=2821107 RepID=UPI001ADA84C7|nr:cytochrome c [Labrenzia sp. R4_2]